MAKVIVTGGAGFIGSHLVDALIARGDEVMVIDNLFTGKEPELWKARDNNERDKWREEIRKLKKKKRTELNPGAKLFEFDIRNPDIKKNFNGMGNDVDYVFHLAALPRVPFSFYWPAQTNGVNITGTLNIIALAVMVNAKRLIYSSSSSVYGNQPVMPLKEDMPANPLSPNGLQKYAGERYCQMLCRPEPNRLNGAVCLRYFNVYGPRQSEDDSYSAVIRIFLNNNLKVYDSTINGDGQQTRDFTWVGDAVRANILAAESDKVGNGEVINIGGGRNYSINQIAKMIGGIYGHGPSRSGDPRNTLADISKAKELLGWEPEVSLPQGIAQLKEDISRENRQIKSFWSLEK